MKKISAESCATLRKTVDETLLLGQKKIEEARVRTYWETDLLIKEHIRANKCRADYGERVSGDLYIDSSVLKKARKFYKLFPSAKNFMIISRT